MEAVAVPDEVEGASNVLVLASGATPERQLCTGLLCPGREVPVLSVTFTEPPDERMATVRSELGSPADTRVIAVGESARSAASAATDAAPVTTVEHPADLTELGIRIGTVLDEWDGEPFAVCFHSLTDVLEHTSVQRLFRFLHVTTAQLSRADAVAHYHLDPDVPDDAALATLRPLFDRVVRRVDGEWVVD